jgi:cell division protein FtsQ
MKAPAWATRTLSVIAAIAVMGTLAATGWEGYRYLAGRPVAHVVFSGDAARVASSDLAALAASVHGMTSMEAIRSRAREVPWVRDASVRRAFPDGVEIEIDAFDAVARWGDDALASSRGEIFHAAYEATLPRVRAPDAMAPTIARALPQAQDAVKAIGSPISEITVSPRGAWHVVLASGLELEAGRADVAARLARFAGAWPQLAAAGTQAHHADLRYANGFALRRVADVQPMTAGVRPASRSTRPQRKK